MVKRALDVGCSALGLLLLSPVLLSLAALIKWGSEGPVFYRGWRVGLHGRPFRIFKFRSMVVNAESIGGSSTSDHDPRITPIGRFMRKRKLDELPQLLNVLLGDMSLVGPRPEVQQYVDQYTPQEKAILRVRPGITDWASIWNSDEGAVLAGSADPDKAYEQLIRPTKLHLQLAYVRSASLWIDLKIVLFTMLALVNKRIVPREINEVVKSTGAPDLASLIERHTAPKDYATVTELPGHGATEEQFSMLHTRYSMAAKLAADKDVLELACGPGVALGYLAKTARRVVGGDYDPQLVNMAAAHYGSRIEIRELDAQNLPFEDDSFDVLLLLEAIYYLPDPGKFAAEARRVLRTNGSIFICSANPERADFNPSPFAHGYMSAAELRRLLIDHGFDVEMYGGYPVSSKNWRERLLGPIRRAAVKMRLIPKTMAWKIKLKRLLFGKLKPIPLELTINENLCNPVANIDVSQPVHDYKVIYAVGHKAA